MHILVLLAGVLGGFVAATSEQAFADTLPEPHDIPLSRRGGPACVSERVKDENGKVEVTAAVVVRRRVHTYVKTVG